MGIKDAIAAYARAYSVSPFGVGEPPKAARIVANIIDGANTVQVQIGVANNNDGANPTLFNTTAFPTVSSPTVSYAGTGGGGIPLGGPAADARNVALDSAVGQATNTLVKTILANGGVWP